MSRHPPTIQEVATSLNDETIESGSGDEINRVKIHDIDSDIIEKSECVKVSVENECDSVNIGEGSHFPPPAENLEVSLDSHALVTQVDAKLSSTPRSAEQQLLSVSAEEAETDRHAGTIPKLRIRIAEVSNTFKTTSTTKKRQKQLKGLKGNKRLMNSDNNE